MKRIFLVGVFFLVVFVALVISRVPALAGSSENARGWMWGGSDDGVGNLTGLGWVSVNSLNCDTDGNGTISAAEGSACLVLAGPSANYGVNIPPTGGAVTGYAWSSNVGWIQFNPPIDMSAPCSTGVTLSGSDFSGCARIMSIAQAKSVGNSGGWDGWIKMQGNAQNGNFYGVKLSGANLSGYAWSNELGWIDFGRVTVANFSCQPDLTLDLAHANICSNDDSGLTVSATNALVDFCSSPSGQKCEYVCETSPPHGYMRNGNKCDPAVIPCICSNPENHCPNDSWANSCGAANACSGGTKNCNKYWKEVEP